MPHSLPWTRYPVYFAKATLIVEEGRISALGLRAGENNHTGLLPDLSMRGARFAAGPD